MVMSTVYIVEPPHPSKFIDLTPAEDFGKVEVLFDRRDQSLSPAPMVFHLRRQLKNFSDDDYIICLGDPSAVAIAFAVACDMNPAGDRAKLLKWDRKSKRYVEVRVDIR